jgi:hypothetical protein
MPVLSIAANSLSNFHQYIIKSIKPQIYEQSYDSLLFSPLIHIDDQFTELPFHQLKSMSSFMVNNIFSNHLNLHFPKSIVIYTDESVSQVSAGYSFYIPELHVSFAKNLPPHIIILCCRVLCNLRSPFIYYNYRSGKLLNSHRLYFLFKSPSFPPL